MGLMGCHSDFSLSPFVVGSASLVTLCIRQYSYPVPHTVIINNITTL